MSDLEEIVEQSVRGVHDTKDTEGVEDASVLEQNTSTTEESDENNSDGETNVHVQGRIITMPTYLNDYITNEEELNELQNREESFFFFF
jgi:hypothetical protein